MGLSLDSLDPGALAHQLVDSFLPKDMQWVGGMVGALVDYECGNELGAAAQAASALQDMKDIPQTSSSGKASSNGSTKASTNDASGSSKASSSLSPKPASAQWSYEPSPPPFL